MLLIEVVKIKINVYMPLYYDVIFKAIFANKSYENILKSFLESYFKINIKEINILNTELTKKNMKENKKHVDLLIEVENKIINIELNRIKNNNFIKRNMAYLFSIYAREFKNDIKNKKDNANKEFIQLNLNKFFVSKRKVYNEVYYLKNEFGDKLEENIKIHEINIDYFHELWYSVNKLQVILNDNKNLLPRSIYNKKNTELGKRIRNLYKKIEKIEKEIKEDKSILWMGIIGSKTKEEVEYILNRKEMRTMAKELREAIKEVHTIPLVISEFDQADIDWYDKKGAIEWGLQEGEKRGIKKGKKAGKIEGKKEGKKEGKIEALKEVAIKMLDLNVDITTIMTYTGLPKNYLESLK